MHKNYWGQAQTRAMLTLFPEYANIRRAVETGILWGDTALRLAPMFATWHTCDTQEGAVLTVTKRAKAAGITNIVAQQEDSRTWLPRILGTIQEPCLIMLDAHYTPRCIVKHPALGDTGQTHRPGGADFPLYAELQAISRRPFADIVLVDDWSLAGQPEDGLLAPGDDSPQWEGITEASVTAMLGRVAHTKVYPKGGGNAFVVWRREAAPQSA